MSVLLPERHSPMSMMRGISGAGHLDRSVMEHAVEIGNNGLEGRFHAGNIAHDEQRAAEAVEEADIDRTMIEQSDFCIVAADLSKFDRTAFAKISPSDVADYIVTNSRLDDDMYSKLTKSGIKICIAD